MISYLLAGAIYTLISITLNIKNNTTLYQAMQYRKKTAVAIYLLTLVAWPIDMVGTVLLYAYKKVMG